VTTILALRGSNWAKSIRERCALLDEAEFGVWVTVVPTAASLQAGIFIDSKPTAFPSVITTDVTASPVIFLGWFPHHSNCTEKGDDQHEFSLHLAGLSRKKKELLFVCIV